MEGLSNFVNGKPTKSQEQARREEQDTTKDGGAQDQGQEAVPVLAEPLEASNEGESGGENRASGSDIGGSNKICSVCDRGFRTFWELSDHIQGHVFGGEKG